MPYRGEEELPGEWAMYQGKMPRGAGFCQAFPGRGRAPATRSLALERIRPSL